MIGDRKTADERRRIYSGEQLVPFRQGRFWEMGPTPWQGGRIKYFRPHWYAAMKAHAEDASLYGTEKEKWAIIRSCTRSGIFMTRTGSRRSTI